MSKLGEVEGHEHGFEDGLNGKARNPRPSRGNFSVDASYETAYAAAYDITYSRTIGERQRIIHEEALLEGRSEDKEPRRQAERDHEI